jgi:hypothetical protein
MPANLAPRGGDGKGRRGAKRKRSFQSQEFLLYRGLADRHDPR